MFSWIAWRQASRMWLWDGVRMCATKHARLCGHVREASKNCAHAIYYCVEHLSVAGTQGFCGMSTNAGGGPPHVSRPRALVRRVFVASRGRLLPSSTSPPHFQLLICPSKRSSKAISVATSAVITTQRPHHGHVHHAHHHHHALLWAQHDLRTEAPVNFTV